MNELGNERRKEYRQTYPKYVTCSHCGDDRLKIFIQDELSLDVPLCNYCLSKLPLAIVRLIKAQDKYITDLEKNRDRCKDIADDSIALIENVVDNILGGKPTSAISILQLRFASENKYTKTLHRP